MSVQRRTRTAGALLLIATQAACGMVAVHGPPAPEERGADYVCTSGNLGPALDVAAAAAGVAMLVLGVTNDGSNDYFYFVSDEFTAIGIPMALLYGISSVVGFGKTSRCRQARETDAALSMVVRPSPGVDPALQ